MAADFPSCVASRFVLALPAADPGGLPGEVIACALAAGVLGVLSLALRGMARLVSFCLVVVLGIGAFLLAREAWERRAEILPAGLVAFADRTLEAPSAREAWQAVESEFRRSAGSARSTPKRSAHPPRDSLLSTLEAKIRELRATGNEIAANELATLEEWLRRTP